MESTRQSKIARLIQKELSEIFLLQAKSMNGVLVSVTAVRVSPDLSIARVYISVFPSERGDEIVKNLNANIDFSYCSRLNNTSILYMIQNEAATTAISITLNASAYDRAMADADIQAALTAHPNVTLAK